MSARCVRVACLLLAVALAMARPASTRADVETGDASAAAQWFDEARALMERGEYAPACPKLEVSQRLDPQLGTQLHLGHCYEKSGQLTAAYQTFQAAAELAARKQDPREKLARERAESLAPRLSWLELHSTSPAPGLEITIDKTRIDRSQWNRALVVEPGEHVLRASAPGHESWQQAFTIGSPARLGITIPALAAVASLAYGASESPKKVQASAPAAALSTAPRAAADSSPPVQRILGYVALGAGVAGLGLGTAFAVLRSSRLSQLENTCNLDTGHCTIASGDEAGRARIESLHDQANAFASGANLAWILGGLAAAGGVVLILTAPHDDTPALTLGIAPGGLSLTAHTDAL